MDDTLKGVLAICGKTMTNGGKRGYLATKWNTVDDKLKEVILQNSSKHELERRFEAITVKEHFTNLYGPRLLVDQMQQSAGNGTIMRQMSAEESVKEFNEQWDLVRYISYEKRLNQHNC